MANKISTVRTYPLNGAVNFTITFEYLARKFVQVTLIGKDRKELVLNQDYRFTAKTQITTSRTWTSADGYHMIEIRRLTSATDRLVDFADGSILRAYDLNISQIQTLHVAEEARDLTADTIGVNNDGHLDARGRRIVNLADGVYDGDAISVGQVKRMNQNSWQARNEALQFRNEAETFRNQAEGFKTESGTSATKTNQWRNEAEGFRDEAEQFKNTATQQATASANSAAAAHQSEVNASASAAASANSATLAEQQADRAELEADKLGNWNKLAGSIDEVYAPGEDPSSPSEATGKVIWRYGLDAPVLRAYNGASIGAHWDGTGDGPFINWYRGKGNYGGAMRITEGNTLNFQNFGSVRISGSTLYGASGEFSWLKSTGDVVVDNTLHVNGTDYIYKNKWAASGPNRYVNFIRGVVNNTFYSDDYFAEIVGKWLERGWHIYGGSDNTWMRHRGNGDFALDSDKGSRVILNNNGLFQDDGNIRGTVWGGWLSNWLGANTVNHIAMGGVNYAQVWNAAGIGDGGGKVITGIINSNSDSEMDGCHWRVMQYVRNDGQRFNIY